MEEAIRPLSGDERAYLDLLAHVPGLGAGGIRKIYEHFPGEDVLLREQSQLQLLEGIGEKRAAAILETLQNAGRIRKGFEKLEERGIRMVTWLDAEYPERLRRIPGPPAVLYVIGRLPDPGRPAAAIVGSRGASNYGMKMAEFFGEALAAEGVDIISGLAAGIDGCAHRGAMKAAGGRTYAVLGGGVNICYPKEHFSLYESMGRGGRGGLLSETVPDMQPLRQNFPMRNRIISGLADAVLVMEAREKSGSLITADHALEQNREVMALPGRITDPMSRGCNRLIDMGAKILISPDDVMECLGMLRTGTLKLSEKNLNLLAKKEKLVYGCVDFQPKYAQEIARETGLPAGELMSILLNLELKGYIRQISASYYGAT